MLFGLGLLINGQLYTIRSIPERGREEACGWRLAVSDRWKEKSRQLSTLYVLIIQAALWCSDSLRCWVKLLQSQLCRAPSTRNVYLAPQSPESENNTSMQTLSCCIYKVILVLSAVIQTTLGVINCIFVAWKPSQSDLLCWFHGNHGRRQTFWEVVVFQRTGEDRRCADAFPYRSHLTSIIFIPPSVSGLCAQCSNLRYGNWIMQVCFEFFTKAKIYIQYDPFHLTG